MKTPPQANTEGGSMLRPHKAQDRQVADNGRFADSLNGVFRQMHFQARDVPGDGPDCPFRYGSQD